MNTNHGQRQPRIACTHEVDPCDTRTPRPYIRMRLTEFKRSEVQTATTGRAVNTLMPVAHSLVHVLPVSLIQQSMHMVRVCVAVCSVD